MKGKRGCKVRERDSEREMESKGVREGEKSERERRGDRV